MYVYKVDSMTIKKFLKENGKVILGIYEENCTISSMFKAMMTQLRKNIDNDYIILLINKLEYMKSFNLSKVMICPKIIIFKGEKEVKTIEGFMNFNKIKEKITA